VLSQLSSSFDWWHGIVVMRCVRLTKLLYAGSSHYLDGWLSAGR